MTHKIQPLWAVVNHQGELMTWHGLVRLFEIECAAVAYFKAQHFEPGGLARVVKLVVADDKGEG